MQKIVYEFYCEELFVVEHKTQYSCESAIYFDLSADIIKENCEFHYYFNKTDVKPSVLDGRQEIVLANWPNTMYVTCNDNHNYPIKISSHPYVLLKRTVLCNCDIHGENHFLLESIAVCLGKQSALTMYYTVGAIIQMPISVKIPLRDKYKLRSLMRKGSLLLHAMLRQETSWYALDNVEYLLPPPHLEESEI